MIQRILSLDISYIMAPEIAHYTDWLHDNWDNTRQQWEMVVRKFGAAPEPCPRRIEYMLSVFKRALPSVDGSSRVIFSRDSHDILEHVSELSDIVIHSVDHHHDIFYAGKTHLNQLNKNNWVWWLDRDNVIKEYTWFGNRSSAPYDESVQLRCKFKSVSRKNQKPMSNPDLIFVCQSPSWVPESGQELYRTLQSISDSYWSEKKKNEV